MHFLICIEFYISFKDLAISDYPSSRSIILDYGKVRGIQLLKQYKGMILRNRRDI